MRKTKIVCTIGPTSESEEMLRALCKAGMNVARLNFSHGDHEEHLTRINRIKKVRAELGLPIHRMEAVFPSEPPRDLEEILREKPLSAKPRVNPGSLEYVGGDVRRTQGVG